MMKDHEPDSGFNLPAGCMDVDASGPFHVCWDCIHCIEECCDYGACELKIGDREPRDFTDWDAVLDFLNLCRVDMQTDTCPRWEECL